MSTTHFLRRDGLIVGLLGLLMLAVYLPTLVYPLVYDDLHWLPLRANWSGWDARYLAPRLPWVGAQWLGGGLPWAFHLLAISVHAVNGWLLWLLARRWLSVTASTAAVALFWLWPGQVEAVAYVSGANESLVTLYVLLAILLALHRTSWGLVGAAGCLYLAASLKPSALPVLFVVPMAVAPAWAPIAGVAGLVLAWPALVYTGLLTHLPTSDGFGHVAVALWRYLLPFHLSIVADWSAVSVGAMVVACSALVHIGVLAWINHESWAAPWYAWLWIVGLTLPRGLVPSAPPLTGHHTYLPFLALWLLCGAAIDRYLKGTSAWPNRLPLTT